MLSRNIIIPAVLNAALQRATAYTVFRILTHRTFTTAARTLNNATSTNDNNNNKTLLTEEKPIRRPEPSPSFNVSVAPPPQGTPGTKKHRRLDKSLVGLTGGQIFNEMMRRHNVEVVFGYPGGAILPVYDAIYESPYFKFVLPKHEQGAGHMAEGYARASGKPGVVLVTSGPGATNVITPITDALMDGIPLVVFTGQVPTSAIGTDAFQEADTVGISRACTKWNVMVKDISELPLRINEAFEIATSGRPGPVLVDLPKDVTASVLKKPIPTELSIPMDTLLQSSLRELQNEFIMENIQRAADLVNMAKRPVLYVGGGILNNDEGPKVLKELSDLAQIPVTTTLQALGSFDQNDPKSLGMVGMHGSGAANLAIQHADLIIAVGARFDDRVTSNVSKFAPEARKAALEERGGIIHFEISPKNINKVVQAQVAVEGDAATNLQNMLPKVLSVKDRSEWLDQIKVWKEKYPYRYTLETPGSKIKPQTVITKLSEIANSSGRKVIVTTGVGQHQMWAAQHWTWKTPRTFITSGGLGTMGFGLPAAIGAQVAEPDALVIDIDGDASFNMTLMELSSAVQAGAPVKVVILNNGEQGMVVQWQSLFYEDRFSHTHQLNPDFVKLAESMGWTGIRVSDQDKLEAALREFVFTEGPVLLDVKVESNVHVMPMVPAGKGLDEFLYYDPKVEAEQAELRHKHTKNKY